MVVQLAVVRLVLVQLVLVQLAVVQLVVVRLGLVQLSSCLSSLCLFSSQLSSLWLFVLGLSSSARACPACGCPPCGCLISIHNCCKMHTIVSKFNILSILTFIIVLSSLPLSKVRQRCVITYQHGHADMLHAFLVWAFHWMTCMQYGPGSS